MGEQGVINHAPTIAFRLKKLIIIVPDIVFEGGSLWQRSLITRNHVLVSSVWA
jgi:hypothetical protein